MKTFNIYLKSPALDTQDYERTVKAYSKAEAVAEFYKELKKDGWTMEMIAEHVTCDEELAKTAYANKQSMKVYAQIDPNHYV